MVPETHLALSPRLCGIPREIHEGSAVVELDTHDEMRADVQGLVHGGFVFGLADAAAMFAVNHPNVVLGGAETRFLLPVRVGDRLRAHARRVRIEGKKHVVEVDVKRAEDTVLTGTFVCFIPSTHVLERKAAR